MTIEDKTSNTFQACSHLKIEPIYGNLPVKCGLTNIYELQRDIQVSCYGYDWNTFLESNKHLSTFLDWNDRALDSEREELLTALGGSNAGKQNEGFWNIENPEYLPTTFLFFNNYSLEEKIEIWFELIDALHFHLNKGLAIGINLESIREKVITQELGDMDCLLSIIFEIQKSKIELNFNLDFDIVDMQSDNLLMRNFIVAQDLLIDSNKEKFLNALGGKYKQGFWKPWKKNFSDCKEDSLKTLTKDEFANAERIWLKSLELYIAKAVALDMTPKLIVDMYFAKNLENRKRQQKPGGY